MVKRSALILIVVLSCVVVRLPGADYYVSPKGSDNNPGTSEKPFATLERARDAARAAKHDSTVTIWLRGGTYTRSTHV